MSSRASCCLALVVLLLACCPGRAQAELLFSEYIEGTSNNKALEIYNNSTQSADLTNWWVRIYANGSPTASLNIALSGTIAPGDVYVVAHGSANAAILAQTDLTNSGSWFNGNDAVALMFNTTIVDSIGQIGFDPGSAWTGGGLSTLDRTLVRQSAISSGDTNAGDAFNPSVQWSGFAVDTFTNLGSHAFTGATASSIYTHALPEVSQTTTIDFNSFTGSGFVLSPAPGQLDSDNFRVSGLSDGNLAFGATGVTGDFARGQSTGGVTTGGIYAFEVAPGDRALGVQPAGSDFAPGSIFVRLPNETAETIDEIAFAVDLLYNNNEGRSNSLTVAYSTDDISYFDLASITSPDTADALGFQSLSITESLSGLDIAPGEFLYLRFLGADVGGAGSRDEFAINNLSFFQPVAQPVPEPISVAGWLLACCVALGTAARGRRKRRS